MKRLAQSPPEQTRLHSYVLPSPSCLPQQPPHRVPITHAPPSLGWGVTRGPAISWAFVFSNGRLLDTRKRETIWGFPSLALILCLKGSCQGPRQISEQENSWEPQTPSLLRPASSHSRVYRFHFQTHHGPLTKSFSSCLAFLMFLSSVIKNF